MAACLPSTQVLDSIYVVNQWLGLVPDAFSSDLRGVSCQGQMLGRVVAGGEGGGGSLVQP